MPYTLAKFFLWGLLMALAGGIVGWLLRSLKCRGEVARARAVTIDETELERLRGRVANLEPLVAERDRLRMELADVRGSSAGALGFSSTIEPLNIPDDDIAPAPSGDESAAIAALAHTGAVGTSTSEAISAEAEAEADTDAAALSDAATPENAASETEVAPDSARQPAGETGRAPTGTSAGAPDGAAGPAEDPVSEPVGEPAAALDIAGAAEVLGKRIELDDLTVVEGIGPKIAELCSGINITTWQGLADADVAELQSMLDDAGSRFQMHKPASWPQQAALLAAGRWAEFVELTDSLSGGK